MASSNVQDGPGPTAGIDAGTFNQEDVQSKLQQHTDTLPSSTPLEMSEISQRQPPSSTIATAPSPTVAGVSEAQATPATSIPAETTAVPISTPHQPQTTSTNGIDAASSPPAIGPSMDQTSSASANATISTPNPAPSPPTPGPTILITLMLQNGQRHPYKIDTAYLRKRNVFKPETEAEGKEPNPFDISVYALKELIWRDWREEDWEPRPTIPGSIRLIFFGRLLDDKVILRDAKLNPDQPNIIHISVKPQDLIDEEENSKLKGLKSKSGSARSRSRRGGANESDDGQTSAGCCARCCVM